MASKPIRFHPEADREYISSLTWYSERSPSAALDFESEFQRAISAIDEAPDRWPVYLSHFRRYILRQFPFSIVYRIRQGEFLFLQLRTATGGRAIGGSGRANNGGALRHASLCQRDSDVPERNVSGFTALQVNRTGQSFVAVESAARDSRDFLVINNRLAV